MSRLFLRTLREDPADAEFRSHKLLVRAGYIRRQGPGLFAWLPLGLKVKAKVEAIVRDEMEAAGAQEVHFPALLPAEPYRATGRWTEYGDDIFTLQDRKGDDYLLAPTHGEVFDSPGTPTIATLVALLNERHPRDDGRPWAAADTLKNVVLALTHVDGTRELVVVGIPGDREADLKRAEATFFPAAVEPATEADF